MAMFVNLRNFKEKLGELLDGYDELKEAVKDKIIEQASEDLEGYKKKEVVDALLIKGLTALKGKHALLDLIIEFFIKRVPDTTQKIYDKLRAKVEGITKD